MNRRFLALLISMIVLVSGCSQSVPGCDSSEVGDLVIQTVQEHYAYRQAYGKGTPLQLRAAPMEEEEIELRDTITKRKPTDDVPERQCTATFATTYFPVGIDWSKYDQNAPGYGPDRSNKFGADPNNLVRADKKVTYTMDISYTVGVTDDGRVRVTVLP